MPRPARRRPTINRMLDALARRVGLSLSLTGLVLVCALAGLYVERSVRHLETSKEHFSDRYLRNGFMAMVDIQRLLFIVQEAKDQGAFTPRSQGDFLAAADFLYARSEDFRQALDARTPAASASAAVASLDAILAITDREPPAAADLDRLFSDLLTAADGARLHLMRYLEEMGRMQNEIMRDQSRAVGEQRNVVLASLAGLTLIGIAALLLLRREVLARQARDLAERHVEFLAYFDQLTELPNRTQFQSHLAERLAAPGAVTLVLVDLDDFKGINDTWGHAAGDAVLCRVARLLSAEADATGGFAARLGGDEFALVLPGDDALALTTTLGGISAEARKGLPLDGEMLRIGLSMGYASNTLLGADMDPTPDTLFRVADFALYSSKANGRRRYTQYDEALERRFLERRSMIDDLPRAVESGSLDVYLQPKVLLPGGETFGFEALIRWNRNGTVILPEDFIQIAEECGLIFEIDRHVLRSAAAMLGRFNRENGTAYSVSVNLSALHFNSSRIIAWVRDALAETLLEPGLVTLEITETAELRDWGEAQRVMAELRGMGTRISIDDFGTGYSSLAYLRSTVVDEVKIDRSIVEQIESMDKARFLLDGVLDIARNLGLDVVVEGVQNRAQSETLCRLGATRAQGFLYGQPIPAHAALDRLRSELPDRRKA